MELDTQSPLLINCTPILRLCILVPRKNPKSKICICSSDSTNAKKNPLMHTQSCIVLNYKKCYFLYIHKQIRSKVPISLYFVRPNRPSGNSYVSCFLTEKTPLGTHKKISLKIE